MKKGWKTRNLGDLCRIRTGKKDVNEGNPDGEFPFFTCAAEHTFSDNYSFDTEALLIAGNGDVGKVSYYSGKFEAYQRTYVLSDFSEVIPRFLYLILDGKLKDTVSKQKLGNTMPYIKVGMLTDFQLPVPPLAEQKRIVGLLDEAFEAIATAKANTEQNLQNARAIFESYLNEVFTKKGKGWVETKLEDIGKTQTGSTPKTSVQSNYGDFISFVKPGDFNTNGTLDYCKDGLSESGAATTRIVAAGSVLMVCIGATIGKCGYCDQDVTTNQQVNALTPSDGSFNRFIYYQMLTESFQRKVILASGQATLPIINKSKWSALSIWLPLTVAEQKQIATRLDNLSTETQRLVRIYEQKLDALEELKKSLLNKAFAGEL
jgi:type I restriction enzyme S subunit